MSNEFKSDIEIAQACEMTHIKHIAAKLNIPEDDLELYGKYKSKLPLNLINEDNIKKSHFYSLLKEWSIFEEIVSED